MTKQNLLDICAAIQAYQVHPLSEPKYARLRELGRIVPPLIELMDLAQSIADGRVDAGENLHAALNKIPLSS